MINEEIKHQFSEIPSKITREYQNIRLIPPQIILKACECGGCLHGIRKDTLSINDSGDFEPGTQFFFAEQHHTSKITQFVIQVTHNYDDWYNKEMVSVIAFRERNGHDLIPDIGLN